MPYSRDEQEEREKTRETLKALVGHAIREARNELGMTQQQVADKVGVSSDHLARAERGVSMVSLEKFMRIAEVLKLIVTVRQCLGKEPPTDPPALSPKLEAMVSRVQDDELRGELTVAIAEELEEARAGGPLTPPLRLV